MAKAPTYTQVFNIRVTPDQFDAIKAAAAAAGLARSDWIRDALEGVARQELAPPRRRTNGRHSATTRALLAGVTDCKHPPTARRVGVFSDTCSLCHVEIPKEVLE